MDASTNTQYNLIYSTMQLQIVSRQSIKPSSPTPPHLKTHALSLFDQLAPHMYVPLVFFFRRPHAASPNPPCTSHFLQRSLSATLSRYYPFAGRIKDKLTVDCNDEGVTFLEASLGGNVTLAEILEGPKSEIVEMLFVDGLQWKHSKMGPLLAIQVTYFQCGGFAVGVLLSHKLGDLATLVKFVTDWGFITRDTTNSAQHTVNPLFHSADLFPLGDLPPMSGAVIEEGKNLTCKRFVFEASKIEALKRSISDKVKIPTRVEVMTALIYKAIISALRDSNSNPNNHPTLLLQTMNLRTRMVPPLPESTMGNIVSFFPVAAAAGEREVEVHEVVGVMRKEMGEFCDKYAKKFRTEEWVELIKKRLNEVREILSKNGKPQLIYRCSSGCNFPVYGVDFGWGAAAWVTMAAFKMKNTVMMLDDKNGGGIEALISLDDKEMAAFQHNEELLAYTSLNPTANCANY
ncbi:acylsugar acyltransferase 3-like [Cucurbita moschata]|uniref:Acylsugar acyltransferase 3-like n=1 Tax=Cucurbita moschata TaxID=3662 RepID=A0A6J1GI35_CUCMO|nr:acylsugar acyltransferase 3-like [Cucurbita moschata]